MSGQKVRTGLGSPSRTLGNDPLASGHQSCQGSPREPALGGTDVVRCNIA